MPKMDFSINDVYTGSPVRDTTEQTIPIHEEENYAIDNQTTDGANGQTKIITSENKNLITGSILLLVGVMIVLHFID